MAKKISKKALIILLAVVIVVAAVGTICLVKFTKRDPVFTLLWVSDPQWYSFKYPEIIEFQNQWVADNYEEKDIRYTLHTGDFVNLPHADDEWEVMDEAYQIWDDVDLPYGVLAGNHDVDGDDHSDFSEHFGAWRYEDNKWYGGDYEDNFGHYDVMNIEGVDFIFVYLGHKETRTDEEMDWLNSVLAEYNDHIAILCFHEYLEMWGLRAESGDRIFEDVVLKNPNVRMVLCGHNYNSIRLVEDIDDTGDGVADRTVYQVMANYQNTKNGGNGFMRFMECDLENGTITSTTYSPYIDRYGSDYEHGKQFDEFGTVDEFIIPFDFSKPTLPNGNTGVVVE